MSAGPRSPTGASGFLLVVGTVLVAVATTARSDDRPEPPGSALLLVQSELDSLEVAGARIDIDFEDAPPDAVLRQLERHTALIIEIQGVLPDQGPLARSFRGATVKEILEWLAAEVPVLYRAENPDRLQVSAARSRSPDVERLRTFMLQGIQEGLRRSPGHYVAALIEVAAPPECGPESPGTCTQIVKILETFAERGRPVGAGGPFRLFGQGEMGSRSLVFAAPVASRPGVYGATFAAVGDRDRAVFTAALAEAGLLPAAATGR